MRMQGLSAVLALASLCACSEPAAPSRPRGIAPGEDAPKRPIEPPQVAPPPPPPPPRSSLTSPFASRDPGSLTTRQEAEVEDAGAAQGTGNTETAQPAQPEPPRDLPAELAARLGSPTDCLDLAAVASSGGRLNVVVVAQVMPSGRVSRAEASAPGQPPNARTCLERKASSTSLRGPVPGAPLSVTATLPVEVVSQPTQR